MKCSLKTNIIIDLAMFLAMVVTSISGIVIKIIAPLRKNPNLGAIREMAEWVLSCGRRLWGKIHLWAGVVVMVLLVVHIVCHWSAIDGFFKHHIKSCALRLTLYVVLATLLALSVIPWAMAL